jgi:hypothetical protein
MSKTDKSKVARREFLKDGIATAAIGAASIRLNLRAALAQAKREDKPLLTEQNLNRLIPKEPDALRQRAVEAKRDLKGFITKHFYLTPDQTRQLNALSREESSLIKEGIDLALEEGKRIRVQFIRPTVGRGLGLMPVQKPNVPKWVKNVFVDGSLEPLSVVIGVKGKC